MSVQRDMTVGELIAALAEYPDYYPVAPFIEGEIGILTATRLVAFEQQPMVLVGEADIPPHLIEALIHRRRTDP